MGADFNKIQQQKAMKNASRQDRKITKHAHRNVNSEWWKKKNEKMKAQQNFPQKKLRKWLVVSDTISTN